MAEVPERKIPVVSSHFHFQFQKRVIKSIDTRKVNATPVLAI